MLNYLKGFFDKTDPTKSLKNAAFAVVVAFSCFWLSWQLIKNGMTSEFCVTYATLVSAVTIAKTVNKQESANVADTSKVD